MRKAPLPRFIPMRVYVPAHFRRGSRRAAWRASWIASPESRRLVFNTTEIGRYESFRFVPSDYFMDKRKRKRLDGR